MSPISPFVARSAMRTIGRRNFSVMRSMRSFARSFEPHTFQRLPTADAQAPDYKRLVKRVSGAAVLYVPAMSTFLFWPLLAKQGLDGHLV